ncbi:MAG: DUF1249 domain-containing protein [Gammaproteobacteria bacterium]
MINDAITLVSWRTRPRSFVALMALYESNYVRMSWLAGNLASLAGRHVSAVRDDCDLVLNVTERTPYTTTLNLTYRFGSPADGSVVSEYPDMGVRIYHDARVAEAQGGSQSPDHPALRQFRNGLERELDQRWARNVMLNKWLEYCLERGHRFSSATLELTTR